MHSPPRLLVALAKPSQHLALDPAIKHDARHRRQLVEAGEEQLEEEHGGRMADSSCMHTWMAASSSMLNASPACLACKHEGALTVERKVEAGAAALLVFWTWCRASARPTRGHLFESRHGVEVAFGLDVLQRNHETRCTSRLKTTSTPSEEKKNFQSMTSHPDSTYWRTNGVHCTRKGICYQRECAFGDVGAIFNQPLEEQPKTQRKLDPMHCAIEELQEISDG